MTGIITGTKWNYHLHIDGEKYSKKIHWRNGGRSYVNVQGRRVPITFNYTLVDRQGSARMVHSCNGWEMDPAELPKAMALALQ